MKHTRIGLSLIVGTIDVLTKEPNKLFLSQIMNVENKDNSTLFIKQIQCWILHPL